MTEHRAAAAIERAFLAYVAGFAEITRLARRHFEQQDWRGALDGSARRLDLYGEAVGRALRELEAVVASRVHERRFWRDVKEAYTARVEARPDRELAETFLNSLTRRIFTTVGVDPEVEYVADPRRPRGEPDMRGITERVPVSSDLASSLRRVVSGLGFSCGFEDLARDVVAASEVVERELGPASVSAIEYVRSVFFRNKEAYLVGRLERAAGDRPFVLAFLNPRGRVVVDAVLLDEDEISIVFSFTRSYFFVEAPRPAALVTFLSRLMPRKPIAELYTSIGHNKHGKTVFYRDLLHHLGTTDERFAIAPGARGMVMVVFAMPSYDVVFKIIRDAFDYPKTATRADVMAKYRLVFRHDRAGRLVDAQEFEHLAFARDRFEPALVEELQRLAADTVSVEGDRVVFEHLYTERRLVPLDLYLRDAPPDREYRALVDYGDAIRDLAATDVFPGDLLLKNFGVSRHGRVIFYDYDELCLVTDCVFRHLPEASHPDDEIAAEPWFHVGERDIFPEEFLKFLAFTPAQRRWFVNHHAELLTPDFWSRLQREHRSGRVLDVLPYLHARRLHPGEPRD